MLNENLTTLLSTLLGGFLAIMGAVVATYYTNTKQLKMENRKEFRAALEKAYRNLYLMELVTKRLALSNADIGVEYNNIITYLSEIALLIYLYLPQLTETYNAYYDEINDIIKKMFVYADKKIDKNAYLEYLESHSSADINIKTVIENVIRKERFNYY